MTPMISVHVEDAKPQVSVLETEIGRAYTVRIAEADYGPAVTLFFSDGPALGRFIEQLSLSAQACVMERATI